MKREIYRADRHVTSVNLIGLLPFLRKTSLERHAAVSHNLQHHLLLTDYQIFWKCNMSSKCRCETAHSRGGKSFQSMLSPDNGYRLDSLKGRRRFNCRRFSLLSLLVFLKVVTPASCFNLIPQQRALFFQVSRHMYLLRHLLEGYNLPL